MPFTPRFCVFDTEWGWVSLGWQRRERRVCARLHRQFARSIKHPTYYTKRSR